MTEWQNYIVDIAGGGFYFLGLLTGIIWFKIFSDRIRG